MFLEVLDQVLPLVGSIHPNPYLYRIQSRLYHSLNRTTPINHIEDTEDIEDMVLLGTYIVSSKSSVIWGDWESEPLK